MSEATACVPPVFEELTSELRDASIEAFTEPFAEAGTDVFAELAITFAGKAELSEAVRRFARNSEPSSARRAPSAVSNETARRAHQACFMYEWRREKSEHFSRFFITTQPPFRRR